MNAKARRVGRRAQIKKVIRVNRIKPTRRRRLWPFVTVATVAAVALVVSAVSRVVAGGPAWLVAAHGAVAGAGVALAVLAVVLAVELRASARWREEHEVERRETAEQIIQQRVDAGELIRLSGGRLVEAGRYDPAVHGVQLDPEAER